MFKSKGECVDLGEVIATVGDSGSLIGPALYFEVRHRGKPHGPHGMDSNRGKRRSEMARKIYRQPKLWLIVGIWVIVCIAGAGFYRELSCRK